MSVISRRQKNLLLNDVARMINNNNHTAFANHAKAAETVSNGDLKFYIDSPKKEFVIKYGKNEVRINCNDRCIKELKEIGFSDKTVIKGISDDITNPSPTVALSTKGAFDILRDVGQGIDPTHHHDNKYSKLDHNHNSEYASINHTHPGGSYGPHTHNEYANKNHTHWDLPNKREEFEEEIKRIVDGPKWLRILKNVFSGIELGSEVVQYGLVAGLQAQITALHATMAMNGMLDTAQTATTLGSALLGYSSKIKDVGDVIGKIGKSFDSVSGVCDKIVTPINQVSEVVNRYAKIVDEFLDPDTKKLMEELIKVGKKLNPKRAKLPATVDVLHQSLIAS